MDSVKDIEKGNLNASRCSTIVGVTEAKGLALESEKAKLAAESALNGGEGESALPEDKRIEALERCDEDWQHDPENPRNW